MLTKLAKQMDRPGSMRVKNHDLTAAVELALRSSLLSNFVIFVALIGP